MRFIDENGRLFGKISVVDVVVLLLVAAMAGSIFYVKKSQNMTNGVAEEPITYQVTVSGAQDYIQDSIQVGDALFDKEFASGGALGTITEIQELPGTLQAEFNDGTIAQAEVEGAVNLLLTVEGKGLVSDTGSYSINRIYDLGVNSARTYYTKYAEFIGTVTKIF